MGKTIWLVFAMVLFGGWVVLTVFHDIPYGALSNPFWAPMVNAIIPLIFVVVIVILVFVGLSFIKR